MKDIVETGLRAPAYRQGTPGRDRRIFARLLAEPLLAALLVTATPTSVAGQGAPPAKVVASVGLVFGSGARIDTLRVDMTAVLRVSRNDSLLGFASVQNVIGKDQPITYLVAMGPDDQLKDVDILVYREPYGGDVDQEAWRRQFRGKTSESPLRVGRDIRGISGATISAHAVTAGVRRTLDRLTRWHEEGRIR